jgi:nicotinamidase-related amidase
MEALLIIDMQVGSFLNTLRFDAENIINRINLLSRHFRDQGKPVVFIQHDGTKENFLIHGSQDWEVLPDLIRGKKDKWIEKTANDAFYKTGLDDYLKQNRVSTLYITGCATDFCINATLHSALVKDYHLIVVKDAHTTADRPTLTATEIIKFHNWLWENLTPTEGRIIVKATEEILALHNNL